jgi:hypothetical protein
MVLVNKSAAQLYNAHVVAKTREVIGSTTRMLVLGFSLDSMDIAGFRERLLG